MSAALSQANEEGRGARRAGKSRSDNPFPRGDEKHDAWLEGYRDQKQLQFLTTYSTQGAPT